MPSTSIAPDSTLETPLTDSRTTVADLRALVSRFIAEREWNKYHTPRNLAVSICLESAELLEHFQWVLEPGGEAAEPPDRGQVAEEMADVLAYLLSLANTLEIDLAATLAAKMRKNADKYPADRFKGTWTKGGRLQPAPDPSSPTLDSKL